MDIVCNKCSHTIKIPDNKVPKGKAFNIACPKCKNKISVSNTEKTPPENIKPGKPKPENTKQEKPPEIPDENGGIAEDPFEFLEEGAKTAILCESDPGRRAAIKKIIEKMNYHILESSSPRDTLKQMRFRDFNLVILNELFGTRDPEMNHVLKYLSQLNMFNRRNMFVLLISERLRTGDNMTAFNKSVNMIINVSDMDRFEKLIEIAINENERFYRTFKEAFRKIKGV
ncbi:Uncharacterized protein dnl_13070 [Desulfonema limicola]|uniref:Zinc finger/thioredoxin putative domain-containing protein n=1 Tax=Desulfonema limicola TaxID=45656 RepID=A0A975B5A0_9BACT|nr:hypothetical protein [Desulfonema limicola]QTA79058.1 Uncharacterized protein dnl_13070 [Desulfonema limicola]